MHADMSAQTVPQAPYPAAPPQRGPEDVYDIFREEPQEQYDVVELLSTVVDAPWAQSKD